MQAVVVGRHPPSSARVGDRAVITAGGAFHGWLGGSCIRPTVVAEARRALADGEPRVVAIAPDPEAARRPGVAVFPMTCHSGGSMEIYLEPVLPSPALVVFGSSPVARALARLGAAMGYRVTEADEPAEAGVAGESSGHSVVVATMGEDDEGALRAALGLAPAYLGLVASSRRFAAIRETLLAGGVDPVALDRVRCPAGLDLGAKTPEEIAVSVLAEIVQLRRSAGAAEAPAALPAGAGAAAAQATDPICGMSVEIASARLTAEHGGETFYFCCGGCRERFLAEPERYTAGAAAPGGSAG